MWNEIVMCCFCGESLTYKTAVKVEISASESVEVQSLFSHSKCLKTKLHNTVPIGIDLDLNEETSTNA
jgi:hypothetical protein